MLLCATGLHAQLREIGGTVRSSDDGQPLMGTTVVVQGTTRGAITNEIGRFTLMAATGDTLVATNIGFEPVKVAVGTGSTVDIAMTLAPLSIDEVVLVGYGTARKVDLTGAVASVSARELTQVSTPDVLQAMQGRVAGVDITSQSGEPGAGVRIRIRGVGTINSSDPLYVVDGFQTGDIGFLNPNDIEKIDVLKDASAAAIYGSRGANGVVLIQTKRGKAGQVSVEFNAYAGVQNAWRTLDMLSATEYAQLRMEAYENDNFTWPNPETDIEYNVLQYVLNGNYQGTDSQQEVMRQGSIQNYTLSVYGGSEKQRFSLTGTYFNEEGLVKNSDMQKVFLRLTNDYQLTKWLKAGIWAAYTNVDRTYYNGD
ncbi:MAG: hypothetical protein OHK0039_45610 [Bacteroidia bacterium]